MKLSIFFQAVANAAVTTAISRGFNSPSIQTPHAVACVMVSTSKLVINAVTCSRSRGETVRLVIHAMSGVLGTVVGLCGAALTSSALKEELLKGLAAGQNIPFVDNSAIVADLAVSAYLALRL
jgi:hypothetical protein